MDKWYLSLQNLVLKYVNKYTASIYMVIIEKQYLASPGDILVGVDEAGRGPLAGPVVAAAVLFDESQIRAYPEAQDSKKLSPRKRDEIFAKILASGLKYGIGVISSKRIDEINILNATFEAMRSAVEELEMKIGRAATVVLVDGNKKIKQLDRKQEAIIKGDASVKTISLASIIAKVTRDGIMLAHHQEWPEYGFDQHRGYGTKAHVAAIEKLGRTAIHRESFKLKAGGRIA